MKANSIELIWETELHPGEKLILPPAIVDRVGPGHWVITVSPVQPTTPESSVRDHSAFLNSYAAEDEGLYDDYSPR